MLNNSRNSSFPVKNGNKSNLLRYLPFTLSPLVLVLFLSSNMAYATGTTCGSGTATGDRSTACGDGAKSRQEGGTAIGFNANADGRHSVAIGEKSEAGELGTALGSRAKSANWSSTAIGYHAQATAEGSTATGLNAQATETRSTATGVDSRALGTNSVALGSFSRANNANEVNIGIWSGYGSTQTETRTLSGLSDGQKDDEAVNRKQLNKLDTDAQGYANTAKNDAIASAEETTSRAMNRVAESGRLAGATGEDSYAAGPESKATGTNSVALGANSRATRDNEMNIGTWEFKPAESDKQPAPKQLNRSGEFVQGEYVQSGTRILSGVSDGEKDDEAVNRKQLNKLDTDAQGYASTAKTEAKTYTDNSITGLKLDDKLSTADSNAKKYASTAKTDAITAANNYTDTTASTTKADAILTAKKYTDNAALEANDKVLKEANTYTDDTAKKTLNTANEHAERRAVIAENNAVTRSNAYTDESSSRTLERANTYTNHRATQAENNAVARSNAYTNKRFGELKNQVDRNEKRANGGIAGAMAMTAIPSVPGHNFSFGMAASGYRDQGAIAAGMKANITQDTTVSLNTAWDSGNGVGVAAGFSVGW